MSPDDCASDAFKIAAAIFWFSNPAGSSNPHKEGRQFEHLVEEELLNLGLLVYRASRSGGPARPRGRGQVPADLIVINRRGRVLLVKCKTGSTAAIQAQHSSPKASVKVPEGVEYRVVTPNTLKAFLKWVREWRDREP
ncbi:MAG: hypothetical protein ABWK01_06625 [Infirmifilum sp.]